VRSPRFADLHRDHKLSYWLIGLLAASAIFIERKGRRAELALYTLPRAADSLYDIMYQHKASWRRPPYGYVSVCVYGRLYVYVAGLYVCVCACMRLYACMYTLVSCLSVHVYAFTTLVCVCVCVCVHVFVSCLCVCVCVLERLLPYVCMCICRYTFLGWLW
jgi:hypothetical protein